MSKAPLWPGGARGALSLSFDNLGEAAEIELGAIPADATLGDHPTATEVVPALLDRLGERAIAATFFVEGLNTEIYPELLAEIASSGHELAYHAWRHEQWAELSAAEQADNLARGRAAFKRIGLEVRGLRPPGGLLGPGGLDVLREAGMSYSSPAGAGAGADRGVAVLPFEWRHVDASCVLPPLAPARERMTGSPDAVDPARFAGWLGDEIGRLEREGGYMTIVLHPFMLNWLGDERLAALLDRVAGASTGGDIWVARCTDAAEHVRANSDRFRNGTVLDSASWT